MYKKVGIRELNQHLTRILADIEGGDGRVVTKRDRPVAVLVPVEEATSLGLLGSEDESDARTKDYNLKKARNLFERVHDLGEDVPEHAQALEAIYKQRRTSSARIGSWASSLTQASS